MTRQLSQSLPADALSTAAWVQDELLITPSDLLASFIPAPPSPGLDMPARLPDDSASPFLPSLPQFSPLLLPRQGPEPSPPSLVPRRSFLEVVMANEPSRPSSPTIFSSTAVGPMASLLLTQPCNPVSASLVSLVAAHPSSALAHTTCSPYRERPCHPRPSSHPVMDSSLKTATSPAAALASPSSAFATPPS